MAASAFVIFAGDATWRIGVASPSAPAILDVPIPEASTPAQTAALVASAMREAGYGGAGALLALPAAWCLVAPIDIHDLPPNDRKAMIFRLEEKLPIAAEAIVADFICGEKHIALGVAARVDRLAPLVAALEGVGVAIQSITPAVLLAVHNASNAKQTDSPRVVLCGESDGGLNLLAMDATNKPSSWSLIPSELDDLKLQLNVIAARVGDSLQVDAMSLDPLIASDLIEATGQIVNARDESMSIAAVRAASDSLAGKDRPWVEFRRGPLGVRDPLRFSRRPLDALLAMAAFFFLSVALVFVVRAERYARQEQAFDSQTTEAFHRQFPGWAIPGNVKALIESEHRKSAAAADGAAPADARLSALQTMRAILTRLPTEGRYAIDHMTFEDASFEITGRLRSYEQVDALVSASRRGGFDVPPPQTRRNDDGTWGFTLRGTKPAGNVSAVVKNGVD